MAFCNLCQQQPTRSPHRHAWYSLSTENGVIFLLHVVVKRHVKPKGRGNAGMYIRKFYMRSCILKPLNRFLQTFALMEISRYRIARIFRGSKFSRIAVFENFVEIISRIRSSNMPHPHFSGARWRATKD